MENQPLPPPQPPHSAPPLTPHEERLWGMLAHLLALVGGVIPIANIVAPLVIWQIYKDRSAYVTYHAKESLNFQITITIAGVISLILIVLLIGIALIYVVGIVWLVFTIIAGVKANNGEYYRYPFTLRLID